ncbi:MAG: ChbG/HpnK family deacetylase [Candidatus Marinimicrobia bacterium]|nr:ChbG/HpnK family deacetylase [Candidatus Neomarinimicrobiota bacterium]
MKRIIMSFLLVLFIHSYSMAAANLIIRCDDIGMNHSVNLAVKELLDTGLPINCSVMFPCGWYLEGINILKEYDNVSVGIHLVLNSEWQEYKWGPVSGRESVPSLVDSNGFFFPTRALFEANKPDFSEVEKELRAQIERAIRSGINISYMDYHMGTAASTPEYQDLLMKLAGEYQIGISRFYGEEDMKSIYAVDFHCKTDSLIANIKNLPDTGTYLLVCHIGKTTPEMNALTDTHSWGLKEMSRHRQAELDALKSEAFQSLLKKKKINILMYDQLLEEKGVKALENPF